jgi:hypothetical protein
MTGSDAHAAPGTHAVTGDAHASDFRWVEPEARAAAHAPIEHLHTYSLQEERAERTEAAIVIVLTIACTALALLDLFLLADGLAH